MPGVVSPNPCSWAEQVERGDEEELHDLPPPVTHIDEKRKIKTITSYKYNDEGKKVREVRTYRFEIRRFSKAVAQRKAWQKFGAAEKDGPGPNPANTIVSEAVFMQFMTSKDSKLQEDQGDGDDPLAKLKGAKMVSCRVCKGDHWTTKCPYKDTLAPIADLLTNDDEKPGGGESESGGAGALGAARSSSGGKYVPPSRREGANARGESMATSNGRDDSCSVRVSNLPEDTTEEDIKELFKTFGKITRTFLSKDRNTGNSRGFAFVNFSCREEAKKALGLDKYGYGHLILHVEMAKPPPNSR